jgi:hypothetical protein
MVTNPQTWLERLDTDPTLRVFFEAQTARLQIALKTAQDSRDHWRHVAETLSLQLAAARSAEERARLSNLARQRTFRRKHQFVLPTPVVEEMEEAAE